MNLTLQVWRQAGPGSAGGLKEYQATGVSPDMSFLEMLDVVNEGLIEPTAPISLWVPPTTAARASAARAA
jgi:succinate dehydrogenase/fumarate reductase-like Fe-S protein